MCHIQVRGLAHRGHWYGPLGPFFERFGAVKASPLAAFRLLSQGEAVLLYPGGGKEVSESHPLPLRCNRDLGVPVCKGVL